MDVKSVEGVDKDVVVHAGSQDWITRVYTNEEELGSVDHLKP